MSPLLPAALSNFPAIAGFALFAAATVIATIITTTGTGTTGQRVVSVRE